MALVKIDPDKLINEFEKRGLSKGAVSVEIGHNRNYFTDALRRKTIPNHVVVALLNNYNIKPEDYELAESKEKQTEQSHHKDRLLKDMTDKQVYQLMYSAVYHAVKKAWSE